MAFRTNNTEVKEILDTDVTDFTAFITVANSIVSDELATPSKITSTVRLKEIERWLAAHFFKASVDPQEKTHEAGETKATFFGMASGEGLRSTLYGQQALALDTSGTLSKLGKVGARFSVILGISRAEEVS